MLQANEGFELQHLLVQNANFPQTLYHSFETFEKCIDL